MDFITLGSKLTKCAKEHGGPFISSTDVHQLDEKMQRLRKSKIKIF